MDIAQIIALVTALVGTGGAGAFLGKWLGHRERIQSAEMAQELAEQKAETEKYWRLVDGQEARLERMNGRVDSLMATISAQQQQIATLQSEVHELRSVRDDLEHENRRLRQLLADNGIAVPGDHQFI